MAGMPNLIHLDCFGCGACGGVCSTHAVSLKLAADGFLYPQIDVSRCVNCHCCEDVCKRVHSIVLGRRPHYFAARNTSASFRLASTSGGVFGALANKIIQEGGCVFGCVIDTVSYTAFHCVAETVAELFSMHGSKYIQSDVRDTYRLVKEYLGLGRKVLFSGTPCQIAALREVIGADNSNLLCVEVACHGVGSPSLFARFVRELSDKTIDRIAFRDKRIESGKSEFVIEYSDGTTYSRPAYGGAFGTAYLNGWVMHPQCSHCIFKGKASRADLTIGDFWGVEHVVPVKRLGGGISLIAVRTERGMNAVRQCMLELDDVAEEKVVKNNPSFVQPFVCSDVGRKQFNDLCRSYTITEAVKVMQERAGMSGRLSAFGRTIRTRLGRSLRSMGLIPQTLSYKQTARVGIQTINRNFLLSNYGSFFQHYALRQVLIRLGYSPFRMEPKGFAHEVFDWLLPLRRLRTKIISRIRKTPFVDSGFGLRFYRRRIMFLRDYRRLIGSLGESDDERTMAYIAGGDCIWTQPDRRSLLKDVPIGRIKLSYAVSADWRKVCCQKNWVEAIKENLSQFVGVGIREEAGVEACKKNVPTADVERVLDPVLLLKAKDYQRIASFYKPLKKNTMLAYIVNGSSQSQYDLLKLEQIALKIKGDLKVIGIQGTERYIPSANYLEISPSQFIAAVRDCEAFITNSFHGLTFALLFKKHFVFLCQPEKGSNDRQLPLLERLGLQDQIVGMEVDPFDVVTKLKRDLDWVRVEQLIDDERRFSIDWLAKRLEMGCT